MAGRMNTMQNLPKMTINFSDSHMTAEIKDRHLRHWDKVYVRDT